MQQFSNQEIAEIKSRIVQIHEMLASRGDELPGLNGVERRPIERVNGLDPSTVGLVDQISFTAQMRRIRKSHFGDAQMSGPTWDMMLDLMLAQTQGRDLSASDLATGAGVPLSSGLRMITMLESLGLARRSIDARDRRRSIVKLTDDGTESMRSYFEKVSDAWKRRYNLAL